MSARKAIGLALTILGLVLMLYTLASPFIHGKDCIGYCPPKTPQNETTTTPTKTTPNVTKTPAKTEEKREWTLDMYTAILGWFLLIIGPAVAYGETPVAIEKAVKRQEGGR